MAFSLMQSFEHGHVQDMRISHRLLRIISEYRSEQIPRRRRPPGMGNNVTFSTHSMGNFRIPRWPGHTERRPEPVDL